VETILQQEKNSGLVKIVLYGPESTGKTTFAKALAAHYNTKWVPEYAREFLQEKFDRGEGECQIQDLLPIANGQIQSENDLAFEANKVLFCDTDLLVTMVYSEIYYGEVDPILEKAALENNYSLYILTGTDVPWVADDLRDAPDEREEMYEFFRGILMHYDLPFITVKGNEEERMKKVVPIIDAMVAMKSN
jgi:HTH-type transcriptional repressor of NAD biosynthesis genes